ncbi:sigma-70 family RNA polymerase sigma factor [Neobacillus niacini]|uniref:sigma-70 family RNA polymerase sigma factor n=1 Tax=Neobacillus niacini TaxID=86668 RepID=UPI0021CAFDA9|nr:sigma-70 family RNA polymerase sigma factor [Neobacillus niacini]MCM3764736.1 sigma-70 family RNA polymerase sigma factor [Neobacillus niacini]
MAQNYNSKFVEETLQPKDSFWAEHYPKLQRYCHFLAQNEWDGDDIAQETYLKALRYGHEQQKLTPALLNKIAYHHWIDLLRKRKKETIFEKVPSECLHHPLDDIKNTVDLMLKQFTPKQAVIFLLKEAFQYQINEISEMLETTEMAVKANLHRAKKRIEKQEDDSFSVDSFWTDEERDRYSELFYEALKNQDPTILIKTFPAVMPKDISENKQKVQMFSPSSTLCMAA